MTLKPTLAIVLFPGLLSALSYTCDPPPETPLCQFPKKIAITFVGKAIETNPVPANGDAIDWFQQWFRFQIEEPFNGLQKNEKYIVVYEGFGNERIRIGENYFVHAFLDQGIVKFVNCGITGPVSQRTSEIENMRAWARNSFKPYIAGSILLHYEESQLAVDRWRGPSGKPRSLRGVKVQVSGPSGNLQTKTDANGNYRFANVAPGSYKVRATLAGYELRKHYSIEVPPNGCGIGHLGMFTNAGISGRVIHFDGKPASGVSFDLIDIDPNYRSISHRSRALISGENGEFSFQNLPSGRFYFGVNIESVSERHNRIPPTYFPGVLTSAEAKIIELQPNQQLKDLVFRLPPPRPFRTITVNFRSVNGSIPKRGVLDVWLNKGHNASYYDPENGKFAVKVLQGVNYRLTVGAVDEGWETKHPIAGPWLYSEEHQLKAGASDETITLVVRHLIPPSLQNSYK